MLFVETALDYLNRDSEELAPLTVRTYYWNLKKIEYFAPQLACEEINESVVKDYRQHLVGRGDKEATIMKALSVFRIFTNKMFADGLLLEDPFKKIKVHRVHSSRGFLTTGELKKLYLNYMDWESLLSKKEREVLRAFLFSCFTGLRYSDLKTLDGSEIFDWKIRKQTHKTGEFVYIPIPIQARLLLPSKMQSGKIFHIIDNGSFNKVLRAAASKLGIHRYIHCHLARHTFATTCISLGIPLPATSKLLGHRNLETTLIYAKYVDSYLDKEMKKFNKLK